LGEGRREEGGGRRRGEKREEVPTGFQRHREQEQETGKIRCEIKEK